MVSTEGSDWKRHRSVANSAFNEVSTSSKICSRIDLPRPYDRQTTRLSGVKLHASLMSGSPKLTATQVILRTE